MIGERRRRRDGEAKVRGATRYVADMPVYGLLHARPVLAAEAHALITGIDGSEALAVPGVVAVLTAADLPLAGGSGRAAEPLAREEIVWSGQPVALVVAESEAAAEDGAALVVVDTDPLPPVMDLEAALAPDAPAPASPRSRARTPAPRARTPARRRATAAARRPASRGDDAADEAPGADPPNVVVRQQLQTGDVAAGLARADAVVSGRFRTSWVHQAYLEPQAALAWLEPDGELVVHASTQGAFMVARGPREVARAADRPRPRAAGADRRRVRRQADDLRAARGGRGAQAPAARAARVRRAPRTSRPRTRRPAS